MKKNVWITSTRSGSNGQCVEVWHRDDTVAVRDSKNPDGGMLRFDREAWITFLGWIAESAGR